MPLSPSESTKVDIRLVMWLNGKIIGLKVTLHWAGLVLRWVTAGMHVHKRKKSHLLWINDLWKSGGQVKRLNNIAYMYTPQLLGVTCHMESHSVTCYPTQVNAPRLNPSQKGSYSINLPHRDGRLSWPRWLVMYRDGVPARRQSPIQVLIGPSIE